MTSNLINENILDIFKKYNVIISKEEYDKKLEDFMAIDSITYAQILVEITKRMHIAIEDKDFLRADLTTFNNIVSFVASKKGL